METKGKIVSLVKILIILIILLSIGFLLSKYKNSEKSKEVSEQKIADAIKKIESEEPPRISDNPTEEEVYNNEYIKHIRVALDDYLAGKTDTADEAREEMELSADSKCGLGIFDKTYYQSKFIVISAEDNDYGGVQADIFFIDHPDKLFWVWVYKLGDGEYSLRAFCEDGPAEGMEVEFQDFTKGMIENSQYSL